MANASVATRTVYCSHCQFEFPAPDSAAAGQDYRCPGCKYPLPLSRPCETILGLRLAGMLIWILAFLFASLGGWGESLAATLDGAILASVALTLQIAAECLAYRQTR